MLRQLSDFAKTIVIALTLAFAFQTAAFATYHIPSESMVPTLEVGDRLTVSKFAYGYSRHSLPFEFSLPAVFSGRLMAAEPKRGDIIVFVHPRRPDRMIKRLIGLPGDRIAIRSGEVILNGEPLQRTFERRYKFREHDGPVIEVNRYRETLPGGPSHVIIERADIELRRSFPEITIPAGRYFMMGDNRDNSADSRYPDMGLVPAENLVGRAEAILYSFYDCQSEQGLECGSRRYVQRLD